MSRSKVSRSTLEKESLLEVESEKVEMTLNTDSAVASGLLIQRLTELYEDPVEASVRETISNALDAVTETNSEGNRRVNVTSPSTLNPIFIVEDNGVGMTYEDLKEIYSKYGASTKMNNMDQIGAYGLGAKAPLAYGTEFTVSSVKDGEKTTIIVAREELTNYIKIIDTGETDEPSGTTVSIPVSNYDIERFESHINKYHQNPIDVNADLIIDEEKVGNDDYVEVTDNMLLFKNDEETVRGRLWISKSQTLVNVLSSMDEDDVRRSLKYIIGGWAYKPPRERSRFISHSPGIVVELKAGLVAFNSSRDAILENERYDTLEDRIVEYIKSNEFTNDLINSVNEADLDTFKILVMGLLRRNEDSIVIDNGEMKVNNKSGNRFYRGINREYSISDLVHKETGYRFDQIIKGAPKPPKPTAIIMETTTSYRKTPENFRSDTYDDGMVINHKDFRRSRISSILDNMNDIMYENDVPHSLESLMLTLSLSLSPDKKREVFVTFVTDIEAHEVSRGKTTDYSRLRSGRKTITRMKTDGVGLYDSYIVYTKHSKQEIDNLIKESGLSNVNIEVTKAEDMIVKMNEYRKANRKAPRKRQSVNVNLTKYNHENNKRERIEIKDIEDNKKDKVILVTKDGFNIRGNELKKVHSWYCNTNDVKPDDIELYVSIGGHRIVDLEVLKEVGQLYEDPATEKAGHSNLYDELVGSNVAGKHTLNENADNIEKKAFIRLLSGITTSSPRNKFSAIRQEFELAERVSNYVDYKLEPIPYEFLDELASFGSDEFGDNFSGRYWSLDESSVKHLLSKISEDKYRFIEELSSFGRGESAVINDEDKTITISYSYNDKHPEISSLQRINDNKDKMNAYDKMLISQTKLYLEFINGVIKELSTIKFS